MQHGDCLEWGGCADGLLIRLSDRWVFVQEESILSEDEHYIILDSSKTYDVFLGMAEGKLQCQVMKMSDSPIAPVRSIIPKNSILDLCNISEKSFVFQAVVQARSGIVIPKGEVKKKGLKLI